MNFRLKIEQKGFSEEGSGRRLFSFAVVDLDRSKSYPQNFVCMLPLHVKEGKVLRIFEKVFGDKSVKQAKKLLVTALKSENDSHVKAEIERRLKLLNPKPVSLTECRYCGRLFNPGKTRRVNRKFCPECFAKKHGS